MIILGFLNIDIVLKYYSSMKFYSSKTELSIPTMSLRDVIYPVYWSNFSPGNLQPTQASQSVYTGLIESGKP